MTNNISSLIEADSNNVLKSLVPVSKEELEQIKKRYPEISQQYLDFISEIGVGETMNGIYIYTPDPVDGIEEHQSYQIYNSEAGSKLLNNEPTTKMPDDAIMIADSGASWRYCLSPSKGNMVFCLDMSGPEFDEIEKDFFTFIQRNFE